MAGSQSIQIETYGGPNLRCPFAAVVASFDTPARTALDAPRVLALLQRELPELQAALLRTLAGRSQGPLSPAAAVAALAAALQNHAQAQIADWAGIDVAPGRVEACVGYHVPAPAIEALRVAIGLVALLGRQTPPPDGAWRRARALVESYRQASVPHHPGLLSRALLAAARERGIPAYEVSPGSRVYQYGQGVHGWHAMDGASQWDSLTGNRLASDKRISNTLARRLGLPHTRQRTARTVDEALQAARSIGYPCVVKPPDAAQGRGVVVGAADDAELARGFEQARRHTKRAVLVESLAHGASYRLTVLSGILALALRVEPPQLLGDGVHCVRQLLNVENARRSQQSRERSGLAPILIDEELEATVARQGVALDQVLPAGTAVRLRSDANISTGATLVDVRDLVHPDVEAMAIAFACALRLDALAIDYVTEDLSRSWRETQSAIVDVNTFGLSGRSAARFLEHRFGDGDDGRVPTLLVIAAHAPGRIARSVRDRLDASGVCVGLASPEQTMAGDLVLGLGTADAPHERALALILHPAVEAIVLGCTPAEIIRHGVPLDRCDLVAIADGADPTPALRALLASVAGEVRGLSGDVAGSAAVAAAFAARVTRARRAAGGNHRGVRFEEDASPP